MRTLGAREFQADTHLAETLGFILYMTARRFIFADFRPAVLPAFCLEKITVQKLPASVLFLLLQKISVFVMKRIHQNQNQVYECTHSKQPAGKQPQQPRADFSGIKSVQSAQPEKSQQTHD